MRAYCSKNKISLTRNLNDDVDMILSGLGREQAVDFLCWAELEFIVELRDLRCFLVWDRNLHFPEAEVVGGEVVKCGLLLLLDDILERTNRLFSVYLHLEGFCVRVTVYEAEESDGRHGKDWRLAAGDANLCQSPGVTRDGSLPLPSCRLGVLASAFCLNTATITVSGDSSSVTFYTLSISSNHGTLRGGTPITLRTPFEYIDVNQRRNNSRENHAGSSSKN